VTRSSLKGVLSAALLVLVGLALVVPGLSGCGAGGAGRPDAGDLPAGVDPSHLVLGSLVRVVDGDTILVRMPNGRREWVRYTGIDTPELAREGEPAEPFAEEATARNSELLGPGPLHLELDVEERDRHGRLLAYVWAGGEMVNLRLVREGYAVVLTIAPNVRYTEKFMDSQMKARLEGLGLWSLVGTGYWAPTVHEVRARHQSCAEAVS
jgi:micrococcal nuclease